MHLCFAHRLLMNVALELQPNCLAKLHVEIPPDRVAGARAKIIGEFRNHARIPGFRPGKAPKAVVESRYAKEIAGELNASLVRESLPEAIKSKSLRALSVADVTPATLGADDVLRYEATVVVEPAFALPDYSSIPCDAVRRVVTDKHIEEMIGHLCEPQASFDPIEGRPAAMGDYAVATYSATLDGKPLEEAVPDTPPQLRARRNAWILLNEASFVPGFCEALEGMAVGDEKQFPIPMPPDFPVPALAGKTLQYAATLHALNAKKIPPLDDALADKIHPGSTVESLRTHVAERLEAVADSDFESAKRQAAMRFLLEKVDFELPEEAVGREMRGILADVVRENQMRGISDDEIRRHQEEIIGAAQRGARDRVRGNFLLLRIAEKEKLEVTETDLSTLVLELAHRYEIPVKKFVADLRKRGAFTELREQVLARKALDLLAAKVTVRDSAKPAPSA
jgi:trigger factor